MSTSQKSIRVLLVEDDDFTRTMVGEMLASSGIKVESIKSVAEAIKVIDDFDPHVVLTDLDLGHGPDGADLLCKVFQDRPWTGMVVMTAHASPELAINDSSRIPDPTVYIVKSQIHSIQNLISAIEESINKTGTLQKSVIAGQDKVTITSSQAEILRMVADGLSNASIAESRGISLRAAEAIIQRTFLALGVNGNSSLNPRVVAVRMWHQGKIAVK
ncbi:CitB Response regulator containing a CheY-like receiver domain and an HTH DNA-binding domain [Candidatus Nanopelagicaceae bacterium]